MVVVVVVEAFTIVYACVATIVFCIEIQAMISYVFSFWISHAKSPLK